MLLGKRRITYFQPMRLRCLRRTKRYCVHNIALDVIQYTFNTCVVSSPGPRTFIIYFLVSKSICARLPTSVTKAITVAEHRNHL